jgi:hypothetical protein
MKIFHFVMCHETVLTDKPTVKAFGTVDIAADSEKEAIAEFINKHKPENCSMRQCFWYCPEDHGFIQGLDDSFIL